MTRRASLPATPRRYSAPPPAIRAMIAFSRFVACGVLGHRFRIRVQRQAATSLCGFGGEVGQRFGRWLGLRPIGIRNFEPPQNLALEPLHLLGVFAALVIVAVEMQKTMHRKVGNMVGERLAFVTGLARDGLVGKHDVAR